MPFAWISYYQPLSMSVRFTEFQPVYCAMHFLSTWMLPYHHLLQRGSLLVLKMEVDLGMHFVAFEIESQILES
jgi:hypothetical protein